MTIQGSIRDFALHGRLLLAGAAVYVMVAVTRLWKEWRRSPPSR
jgi:hypothetical protein